ncbi:MAG: 50S ribosomal protein L21e [Nanoarchaeota archaeon]|nr:50S ribosomal protein L21e [Nanoarchaeota archaeon]MBU1051434.1 50S ribosomal protein L21e [Nanoarchaeota archaeon]
MLKHKKQKQKGKFSFTRFFQKFQPGDSVAVVQELSQPFAYSNRLQGRTGKVIEKRGSAYYVEIKDINKTKKYLIRPIHLKRIENAGGKIKCQ